MPPLRTRFTELVGIEHPIVQDGMGPSRTSKLAAAVSEAGGLGTISIPGMTLGPKEAASRLREHIDETASLTAKPFAVNSPVGRNDAGVMLPISEAYIDAVVAARRSDSQLETQLKVLITSAGFPGEFRDRIADSGLIHIHKVGATRHALKAEAAGVDVIIASGYEMGGHTHVTPMHTFVLGPNVTGAVKVPVLISGGVRDGRTLAAALCLGADGVAMGTRFIATYDNQDWHPAYRERVLAAVEGDDLLFPGVYAPARGLRSKGAERLLEIVARGEMDLDEVTRWKDDQMTRAQVEGDVENGLVPAGQVACAINELVTVGEFVPAMAEEAARILTGLVSSVVAPAAEPV
jgi:NAD(P)H-dependent flavin oxidoreductase YrpB (nitropropane dioxygenase family)